MHRSEADFMSSWYLRVSGVSYSGTLLERGSYGLVSKPKEGSREAGGLFKEIRAWED